MKNRKVIFNILSQILLQIINIIISITIPRLILNKFGSETNGLIVSITQFVTYILIFEVGLGNVVLASLYKPIAENDNVKLSKVIAASNKFFTKISRVSIIFIVLLAIIYPFVIENKLSFYEIVSLVLILGFVKYIQYFSTISYKLLLQADQKLYINTFIRIFILIINFTLMMLLIFISDNIVFIIFISSSIYILIPIFMNIYVKKHYIINDNSDQDFETLKNRKTGLTHNFASFVHSNSDIILVSLFLGLKEVSVYSIYYLIVGGLKAVILAFSSSITPILGSLYAKNDRSKLNNIFSNYTFIIHLISLIIFSSCFILITPFVKLYTINIYDADYIRPLFAGLFILSELLYCLRTPYVNIVYSTGKLRETSLGAIMEIILKISISIILIGQYGILGIAVGSIVSIFFRLIYHINFLKKNILMQRYTKFLKQFIFLSISILTTIIPMLIINKIEINSYMVWSIYAFAATLVFITINILLSLMFNRDELLYFFKFLFFSKSKN